jgi:DNA-binding response OmpR family regulator
VFIGRLRKKLGVDIIRTARGLGYVVGVEDEGGAPAR